MGEEGVIPSPVTSKLFVIPSIETSRSSLRIDRPICFLLRVQRISIVASSITPQILLQSGVFWMAALPRRNTYLSLIILTQSNWLDSDFRKSITSFGASWSHDFKRQARRPNPYR